MAKAAELVRIHGAGVCPVAKRCATSARPFAFFFDEAFTGGIRVFWLGAQLIGAFTNFSGVCVSVPQQFGVGYFEVGAEVPPARFAEGPSPTPGGSVSGSRLQAGPSTEGVFHDTQLGIECQSAEAADGAIRCLPAPPDRAEFGHTFRDSACTNPVAYAETISRFGYDIRAYPVCTMPPGRVFSLGAPIGIASAGDVFSDTSGSCMAAPAYAGAVLFEIGAEMDPTQFAQFTRR